MVLISRQDALPLSRGRGYCVGREESLRLYRYSFTPTGGNRPRDTDTNKVRRQYVPITYPSSSHGEKPSPISCPCPRRRARDARTFLRVSVAPWQQRPTRTSSRKPALSAIHSWHSVTILMTYHSGVSKLIDSRILKENP
jgi:hypothetical protein